MATKKEYQLTEEGKEKLVKELDYLKNTARKENIQAIADARSQGDLSENADYSAAREEQGRIEGRIAEIEEILKNSKIISTKNVGANVVSIGKQVTIIINGMEKVYSIVSTIEADPRKGMISDESPLAVNMKDHVAGDKISFTTANGKTVEVEIKDVHLM